METGRTIDRSAMSFNIADDHFITEDLSGEFDAGTHASFVRLSDCRANVLASQEGHILASTKEYALGRGVYLAGLPYSCENSRLLYRAILWSANKEENISHAYRKIHIQIVHSSLKQVLRLSRITQI